MGYSPWGCKESDTTEGPTQLILPFPEVGGFRTATVFLCLCLWVCLPLTECKKADGLLSREQVRLLVISKNHSAPHTPSPLPSQQPGTGLEKGER